MAKLQSAMVFGLDDKPIVVNYFLNSLIYMCISWLIILGIKPTSIADCGSSITLKLGQQNWKKKQDESCRSSNDTILLLETFERSTTILA